MGTAIHTTGSFHQESRPIRSLETDASGVSAQAPTKNFGIVLENRWQGPLLVTQRQENFTGRQIVSSRIDQH